MRGAAVAGPAGGMPKPSVLACQEAVLIKPGAFAPSIVAPDTMLRSFCELLPDTSDAPDADWRSEAPDCAVVRVRREFLAARNLLEMEPRDMFMSALLVTGRSEERGWKPLEGILPFSRSSQNRRHEKAPSLEMYWCMIILSSSAGSSTPPASMQDLTLNLAITPSRRGSNCTNALRSLVASLCMRMRSLRRLFIATCWSHFAAWLSPPMDVIDMLRPMLRSDEFDCDCTRLERDW